MLSKRDNLLECIRNGNPDRYVNQFEAFCPQAWGNPFNDYGETCDEQHHFRDDWGVLWDANPELPGAMPLNVGINRVVQDIEHWRDYVTVPPNFDDAAAWEPLIADAEKIDTTQVFRTVQVIPGVFERFHDLCEITEALMALYEYPEEVKDLIACITEVELRQAEAVCKYIKPEVLFHHDDWGTKDNTFMSSEMFEEFLLEPYKQIYGAYKANGVQLIIHHSDTYGETLVPYMIDMGIDIWQGAVGETNDICGLVDKYGDKITIMGGIDDHVIDHAGFTQEEVDAHVNAVIDKVGHKTGFIPCLTHGDCFSIFEGCYDAVSAAIDKRSAIDFA